MCSSLRLILFENFEIELVYILSCDRTVGVANGYGLQDRGFGIGVPAESTIIIIRAVQTGCGAGPPSPIIHWVTEAEADHPALTDVESKQLWIYTSTHTAIFIV
jgi:hypothetical protein